MAEHALTLKVLPDVTVQLTPMENFAKLVINAIFDTIIMKCHKCSDIKRL